MRDKKTLAQCRTELLGVRQVIPGLLSSFSKYNIEVTFATVGLLFFDNKTEMLNAFPETKPSYTNKALSPYYDIDNTIGLDEATDPYHFGKTLIQQVIASKQEIGSHTFCHYYCLKEGQTAKEFDADIQAAIKTAKANDIELKSFVFPRDQYNSTYLNILKDHGITSYRGNERSFFFDPSLEGTKLIIARALRFIDSYINISGNNIYNPELLASNELLNLPASRFLRPFSSRLKVLETLRLRRIKKLMTARKKSDKVYHIWWHPHNFGTNQKESFDFLERTLQRVKQRIQFRKYQYEKVGLTNSK